MSNGKNYTVIGVFVVGAVVLAVAGIMILGGGDFMKKKLYRMMYFEGSVKGLDVGAPVLFRGVKIGQVKEIGIQPDPKDLSVKIPVVVEVDPGSYGDPKTKISGDERILDWIKMGLRARLEMQSLVTGKMYIAVDFMPQEKARLVGGDTKYPEIPTVQSGMSKLGKQIEQIPIQEIGNRVSNVLAQIETFLQDPELSKIVHNLNQTILAAQKMVRHVDVSVVPNAAQAVKHADDLILNVQGQVRPIMGKAEKTISDMDALVLDLRKNLEPLAASIKGAADSIKATSDGARPAIKSADKAFANIATMTAQDSRQVYHLDNMLKDIAAASRAIKALASYLERHPEALLSGKGGGKRR